MNDNGLSPEGASATNAADTNTSSSSVALAIFIIFIGLGGLAQSLELFTLSWRDIFTMGTGSALTVEFALRGERGGALLCAALTGVAFAWYYLSLSPGVFFFLSLTIAGVWLLSRGFKR